MVENVLQASQENLDDSLPPSTFWKWLGSVPLLMLIFVVTCSFCGKNIPEVFRSLKVDLPLPTVWALYWFDNFLTILPGWLAFSVVLCWLYFNWAAKTRERILAFNMIAFLLGLFSFIILIGSVVLTLLKIQMALAKS